MFNLDQPSSAYTKYLNIDRSWQEFMTLAEAEHLSCDLAGRIVQGEGSPDLVVGLADGGILPAKVVAEQLEVPFQIVKVRRQSSRYKQRLLVLKNALHIPSDWIVWGPLLGFWRAFQNRFSKLESAADTFDFDVRGRSVALVDDCLVTGDSVRHVMERLKAGDARKVSVNVICWCHSSGVDSTAEEAPDVYLHRRIQFYPWSNNCPHLKSYMDRLGKKGLKLWE